MQKISLVTQQLSLAIDFSRHDKENNWIIDNTYDPQDVLKWIKRHDEAGVVWDLSTVPYSENAAAIAKIRNELRGPIIMLVKDKNEDNMLKLLDEGVDDYLVFPVTFSEITARLKQKMKLYEQVRRTNIPHEYRYINFDKFSIDMKHYRVLENGTDLGLTPKELKLLRYLMKHKHQVLSREQLLVGVWGDSEIIESSRMVDIHISHLRDKLERDPKKPELIKTKRGFGYYFNSEYTTK